MSNPFRIYKAPWGRALVVSTILSTVLCAALAFVIPHLPHRGADGVVKVVGWLPAVLVPFCALFMIRGYAITPEAVVIRRGLWTSRILRAELLSARYEPNAMQRSVRVCGNGGFFSFSGFYRNSTLGSYRAYVTNLQCTVVLRTARKTYVLSPSAPEDFVRELAVRRGET